MKSKVTKYCSFCGRYNMPYGGKNICGICITRKSLIKNDTPERRKKRAEKERKRRKKLGEKYRAKERERNKNPKRIEARRNNTLAWQRANKEYLKNYRKEYRENNKQKVKTWEQNRRARKTKSDGKLTVRDWENILKEHNYSCYYCGKADKNLEQEHKTPLSRGGKNDKSNIVPACRECNARKYTRTEEEFYEYLRH